MKTQLLSGVMLPICAAFILHAGPAHAAAPEEIRGAGILDHPCGKVAAQHMALVHEGKIDDATKLATPAMQAERAALPVEERNMISGMMRSMSQSAEEFSDDIRGHGVLVVDGPSATLTVKKVIEDANGIQTSVMSQGFQIDGGACAIAS